MNAELAHQISEKVEEFLVDCDQRGPAKDAVTQAVERSLTRTQQRLTVSLEDVSAQIGRELADDLNQNLFALAGTWFDQRRGDMLIVPEGTRFSHRQGDSLYLVVEEKPAVRTLSYNDDNGNIRNYRCSLPYVVFVFRFTSFNGNDGRTHSQIADFKIAFAKGPIASLEQPLYVPPLPNLQAGDANRRGGDFLKICMGGGYQANPALDMTEQVNNAIDHYWQSPFGRDWDAEFRWMGERDQRFTSFQAWQTATDDDPLFILGAPFKEAGTLNAIIRTGFDEEGIDTPLRRMVQKSVQGLNDRIKKAFREIDIAGDYDERFVDTAVHRVVSGAVRSCVQSLGGELLVDERQQLDNEKQQVELGLHELLFELERRVDARNNNENEGYWWREQ